LFGGFFFHYYLFVHCSLSPPATASDSRITFSISFLPFLAIIRYSNLPPPIFKHASIFPAETQRGKDAEKKEIHHEGPEGNEEVYIKNPRQSA